jgi:hypothetical protein
MEVFMWSILLWLLRVIIGPVFTFLNSKVTAPERIHIADSNAIGEVAMAGLAAEQGIDSTRPRETKWGPLIFMMMIILAPFVWHEWQVVLDSCRWIPVWQGWFPTLIPHQVGSWAVAALPAPWGTVELAIFQSFFIGAATTTGILAAIKAIRH